MDRAELEWIVLQGGVYNLRTDVIILRAFHIIERVLTIITVSNIDQFLVSK
jgi:hypothetical protein